MLEGLVAGATDATLLAQCVGRRMKERIPAPHCLPCFLHMVKHEGDEATAARVHGCDLKA